MLFLTFLIAEIVTAIHRSELLQNENLAFVHGVFGDDSLGSSCSA